MARLLMQIKCIKRGYGFALVAPRATVKLSPGKIHGGPVSRVNVIVAPYKSRLIAEEYGSYIKTTAAAAR